MSITAQIDKTRKDLEKTITAFPPVKFAVGLGDLAVERARSAGADVAAFAEQAQGFVKDAPAHVAAVPGQVASSVRAFPGQAQETYVGLSKRGDDLVQRIRQQPSTQAFTQQLDATVAKVKAAVTTAESGADETKRAAKAASTAAVKEADAQQAESKATTSTARSTAKKTTAKKTATRKAAQKRTTTTAKKSAKKTSTATKSAATSAKKTAGAAKKAAADAAETTGR